MIGPSALSVKMAADRESLRGSFGYVHDNSTNAAPIDDDGVPAGARADTVEMTDRSTTKTHKIHRGHRLREIIATHPWAAPWFVYHWNQKPE